MILLLRDLGVEAVPYIPDRLMEGYGPSGEALVRLAQAGASLIVTVDCGAQAVAELVLAKETGVAVIVAAHPKSATAPPVAHALVTPTRLDEADRAAPGHPPNVRLPLPPDPAPAPPSGCGRG